MLGARGSDYSSEQMAPMEMAVNYVTTVLGFWGITNPETVVIEGHNQYQISSQQIVEEGLENVKKVAAKF